MANTLSAYDPIFYAQEALTALYKRLGLAARVYRGLDDDQSSRTKGSTIEIRVPGSFVAQDGPSTAQDITATKVAIVLDKQKEVKFSVTDKELVYASQTIVQEHVEPAAYAIADQIDKDLAALVDDIPYFHDWTGPAAIADVTKVRQILFDNKVMLDDEPNMHFMISGIIDKELLDNTGFSQWQGAGPAGAETQMRGYLGKRFGFNLFANQNVPSRTSQTIADAAGAINNGAGYAAGIKTFVVDGLTVSLTPALKRGDIMVVTGHAQQYVVTADANTDAGGQATVSFFGSPNVAQGGLESAVIDNQVVTFTPAGGSGATKVNSIAFHRNWAALAMAKLPDFYNGNGVQVAAVQDPVSRLALRARTWTDPANDKFFVAIDALYGVKTLDGNKAVRVRD